MSEPEESTLYSVVLDDNETPQIVEGEVEEAIFTGTLSECQAEILMSMLLD